jgi:hypothetical protein
VFAAADEIRATLDSPDDQRLLQRLLDHPDMRRHVWDELGRKRRNGLNDQKYLYTSGLNWWPGRDPDRHHDDLCSAFLHGITAAATRLKPVLLSEAEWRRTTPFMLGLAAGLAGDAEWMRQHGQTKDAKHLSAAGNVYMRMAESVPTHLVKRKRRNHEALALALEILPFTKVLFGKPLFSIAATVASVSCRQRLSADALQKFVRPARAARRGLKPAKSLH